jgi:hypothetical protein
VFSSAADFSPVLAIFSTWLSVCTTVSFSF